MFELSCPMALSFQSFGDVPRIADEVVPGERKLEPKPPFLWVQSPANHEPSQKAPVIPTIAGEHALPPHGFEHYPQQVQQGKRRSFLFRLKLPAFQGIEYTFVEATRVVKRKQHPLRAGEQLGQGQHCPEIRGAKVARFGALLNEPALSFHTVI